MPTVTAEQNLRGYTTGESETRPWGSYKVIDTGVDENNEQFCEKEITVDPGHLLSLQSHKHRREKWTVIKGALIVVLDGKRYDLQAGESINIPLSAVHCMANGGDTACIVHERQIGLCSEDDIIRYIDAYGRAAIELDTTSQASADLYNAIKAEITKN